MDEIDLLECDIGLGLEFFPSFFFFFPSFFLSLSATFFYPCVQLHLPVLEVGIVSRGGGGVVGSIGEWEGGGGNFFVHTFIFFYRAGVICLFFSFCVSFFFWALAAPFIQHCGVWDTLLEQLNS